MPFAPKIRKDVLIALDDYIIPALRSQKVFQMIAEPPYDFSAVQCWTKQKKPLRDKPHEPLQVVHGWQRESMVSSSHITFGFVYRGTSYENVGITNSTANALKANGLPVPPGISVVRLPAPAIICYPPHTPRASGALDPWLSINNLVEDVQVLGLALIGEGVSPFICIRSPKQREATHNLQVNDMILVQMAHIYLDELRQPTNEENAQALLLILMCRLRRYLQNHKAAISNSCWIKPDAALSATSSTVPAKHVTLCFEVRDYIQYHINLPLSIPLLARHFGVSPTHLNNIFQTVFGITIMRYVTELRISVAKTIIEETPERISDIAELTGFSSTSSFCNVFRRTTGCSPGEFRMHIRKRRG